MNRDHARAASTRCHDRHCSTKAVTISAATPSLDIIIWQTESVSNSLTVGFPRVHCLIRSVDIVGIINDLHRHKPA